jgi:RNA recognition motif-containing protein
MKKIYVGNLAWTASEDDLRQLFASYGPVQSVAIVMDRETGRSRGFGFVEMEDADAQNAIARLDGQDLKGRSLRVNEALARSPRSGGSDRGSDRRPPRSFSREY